MHKIGSKLNMQHRHRNSMNMTPGSVNMLSKAVMMQPGMGAVIEEDSLDPYNLESQVLEFKNRKESLVKASLVSAAAGGVNLSQEIIET